MLFSFFTMYFVMYTVLVHTYMNIILNKIYRAYLLRHTYIHRDRKK